VEVVGAFLILVGVVTLGAELAVGGLLVLFTVRRAGKVSALLLRFRTRYWARSAAASALIARPSHGSPAGADRLPAPSARAAFMSERTISRTNSSKE